MAGRGRPSKCKLSETEFKELLLNLLVNNDGEKVPLRSIFSDIDFIKKTGYWHDKSKPSENIYLPISEGSMSYIIGKLNLHERELFNYHKFITKRIKSHVDFEVFSRNKNKGYRKGKFKNSLNKFLNIEEIEKNRLVWALNSLSKHMGDDCPDEVKSVASEFMSYDKLKDYIEKLFIYFSDDENKFIEMFRERLNAYRKGW